jgi:hypothetical protein
MCWTARDRTRSGGRNSPASGSASSWRIVNTLRGTPCIGLEDVTAGRKSIMASRSFGRPMTMPDEMAEAVAAYTARGREDAPTTSRHGQPDRASLIVFVETNRFRPGDPRHCAGQGVQLPVTTAHSGVTPIVDCANNDVRYETHLLLRRLDKAPPCRTGLRLSA